MAATVHYRFESFLYPAQVSRIELEHGTADWVYIRRRHRKLAMERKEQVMLYVYNSGIRSWEYLGKVLPDGDFYNWVGHGPYKLTPDGLGYQLKKGGEA